MPKGKPPAMVRPHVARHHGVAGWRNAIIIEPGTEGIPLTPEPEPDLKSDETFEFGPNIEPPTLFVDGRPLDDPEPEVRPRRARKRA